MAWVVGQVANLPGQIGNLPRTITFPGIKGPLLSLSVEISAN
jgi:hypothetical protein